MSPRLPLAGWYIRIIGVAFLGAVGFSLIADLSRFGFRPETMHKVFHVLLGGIVVVWGWRNSMWWHPFALANGGLFTFAAIFGALFPDFGGLDAFNRVDTILHAIVGLSGLAIGCCSGGTRPVPASER